MGRLLLSLLIALYAVPAWAQFSLQDLDHVPVVVRDLEQTKSDFQALGFVARPACAPFLQGTPSEAFVAEFPEGEIMFLSETFQRVRGRPIVALTVAVENLDQVRHFTTGRTESCAPKSLWVETHGFWLEFREP